MRIILFFLSIFTYTLSFAQSPLDTSSSFEDQRQRVNNLLNERSKKFGEYDISLEKKSGIFGLFKSKNDMQKSIDILKQIVINDNNIFIETKKLLELKDSEKEKFEKLANEYDEQVTAYVKTIATLQNENDKLRKQINDLNNQEDSNSTYSYMYILIIISLTVIIFFLYRQMKSKNVTKV